ncbi:MAG: bifunctional fructose-bisphosphatase/inositol-phosphate phosphatase [Methanocellales archaeon]|nr:bifunctional fructose-bisphosphatase/inositol-phosphate phosphatase [Methanocellales archaeon]MDI6903432.1 bifunctional fructose-bisphosphatase/inositol-phosphate phosphatase [Methanocellales archaeon]
MKKLCEDVANAVSDAIGSIIGRVEGGTILYMGADGTPTAKIDDVAERAALRVLKEDGRSFELISEEIGSMTIGEKPELTIVLDPLDGTHNAIHGIPFYSFSMAICGNDLSQIYYGYVRDLVTGDVYMAEKTRGAFLNGRKIRVSETMDEYCVSVNDHITLDKNCKIRLLGSAALELCYVASHKLDALIDNRGYLRVTDISAGKLIVEEAGGIVTDCMGMPLKLPLDVRQKIRIIASNGRIHEKLLAKLRGEK